MATFVFVHGAFQGGWVWQKISGLLKQEGYAVHTPTLTGCGYLYSGQQQPGIDLNSYIADIVRYLDFAGLSNVILAGHSYAGMICGGVMMQCPERISQAVFIDAIIPEANSSFAVIAGEQFQHILQQNRMENDQIKPWPAGVFGIGAEDAPWFTSRLRPFPLAAFQTPFPGSFEPKSVPVSLISCKQTASPFIRAMAARATELSWPVYGLDTGHCPMVTRPEALAEMLTAIAK